MIELQISKDPGFYIGNYGFSSGPSAHEWLQSELEDKRKPGDRIEDGDLWLALRDLCRRHPEGERLIGDGIARFEVVDRTRRAGTVRIIRMDESPAMVELERCIGELTQRGKLIAALRFGVERRLSDHADLHSGSASHCAVTGEAFSRDDRPTIDFEVPFCQLADQYVALRGRQPPTYIQEYESTHRLPDADYPAWQGFFLANAGLRFTKERANISRRRY